MYEEMEQSFVPEDDSLLVLPHQLQSSSYMIGKGA